MAKAQQRFFHHGDEKVYLTDFGILNKTLRKNLLAKERKLGKSEAIQKGNLPPMIHMLWQYCLRENELGDRQATFNSMSTSQALQVVQEYFLNTKQAKALLGDKTAGNFVVRYSQKKASFVVTAYDDSEKLQDVKLEARVGSITPLDSNETNNREILYELKREGTFEGIKERVSPVEFKPAAKAAPAA